MKCEADKAVETCLMYMKRSIWEQNSKKALLGRICMHWI